jgi:hypothetical protein
MSAQSRSYSNEFIWIDDTQTDFPPNFDGQGIALGFQAFINPIHLPSDTKKPQRISSEHSNSGSLLKNLKQRFLTRTPSPKELVSTYGSCTSDTTSSFPSTSVESIHSLCFESFSFEYNHILSRSLLQVLRGAKTEHTDALISTALGLHPSPHSLFLSSINEELLKINKLKDFIWSKSNASVVLSFIWKMVGFNEDWLSVRLRDLASSLTTKQMNGQIKNKKKRTSFKRNILNGLANSLDALEIPPLLCTLCYCCADIAKVFDNENTLHCIQWAVGSLVLLHHLVLLILNPENEGMRWIASLLMKLCIDSSFQDEEGFSFSFQNEIVKEARDLYNNFCYDVFEIGRASLDLLTNPASVSVPVSISVHHCKELLLFLMDQADVVEDVMREKFMNESQVEMDDLLPSKLLLNFERELNICCDEKGPISQKVVHFSQSDVIFS